MSLMEEIKVGRMKAMKAKDTAIKDILTVALGDCQTFESREGKIEDSSVIKIIKKIIAGNNEALKFKTDDKLIKENEILENFLPQMWSADQIEAFFLNGENTIFEQIRDAGNAGQATGIAMKALKQEKAPVEGGLVKEVVTKIRE